MLDNSPRTAKLSSASTPCVDVALAKRQNQSLTAEVVSGQSSDAGLAIGKNFNALLEKVVPLKDWNPAGETFIQ